jgi:hypothetical protein
MAARPVAALPQQPLREPALSLFLLFLQEIISYRHRFRRRNPGIQAARRIKKQRVTE